MIPFGWCPQQTHQPTHPRRDTDPGTQQRHTPTPTPRNNGELLVSEDLDKLSYDPLMPSTTCPPPCLMLSTRRWNVLRLCGCLWLCWWVCVCVSLSICLCLSFWDCACVSLAVCECVSLPACVCACVWVLWVLNVLVWVIHSTCDTLSWEHIPVVFIIIPFERSDIYFCP